MWALPHTLLQVMVNRLPEVTGANRLKRMQAKRNERDNVVDQPPARAARGDDDEQTLQPGPAAWAAMGLRHIDMTGKP